MSESVITIELFITDRTNHREVIKYFESQVEAEEIHVKMGSFEYPKAFCVLQLSSYSEKLEDVINETSELCDLAAYSIFHDMTGEKEFICYEKGKPKNYKEDEFVSRIHENFETYERGNGNASELTGSLARIQGEWVSIEESSHKWAFVGNRFSASYSGPGSQSYVATGTFTIGEKAIVMDMELWDYHPEDPKTMGIPLSLTVEDIVGYQLDMPSTLHASCLFTKSPQKMYIFGGGCLENHKDYSPYGSRRDIPIGTYDIEEFEYRKI